MVWNSSQSSLYRAVEAHNQTLIQSRECSCEEKPPHSESCRCEKNTSHEMHCRQINSNQNFIAQLLSDSDTLLLAALLMVLIHEKADKNLIIAIALIMIL